VFRIKEKYEFKQCEVRLVARDFIQKQGEMYVERFNL
jgi:hypothetical protein